MGEIFKASGYVYVRQESDDENFIFVPIKSSDGHRKFALSIVLEDEVFSIYIHDDTNKEWIVVDINEGVAMAHDRLRAEVHTEEIIFRFQFPSESDVLRFKHYFDFAMFCVITGECILPPTPDDDEDGDIEWITSMLSHTELSDFSETTINSEFEDTGNLTTLGSRGENQCFTDSIMYSHAIVLKVNDENTSSIAAFRYDADGFVGESEDDAGVQEFSIATLDNKQICAKYALLTDTESHVLVQDSQYDSSLFDVDLSRGSVVQEYKAQDHSIPWAIQTVSATENDSVISCCSKNTLFGIDRRLRGDACVVLPHGKSLTDFSHTSVTNRNRFTCHATSDNGFVVVGDLLGQLRLFSGTPGTSHGTRSACHPKSARTLLPGLRRPLTAVDITRDGRYVVGTCDAFLVVVATTFTDENNRQTNGFEKRMGKKKKPPVRLELTPEQVALMGGRDKIVLRHATFELGKACARWIIATCGNATVRWSFDAVRARIEQGTTATEYDVKAAVVTERGGIQSAYLSGTTHDEITPLKFITTQTVGMRTYRTSDSPIKRKMKS